MTVGCGQEARQLLVEVGHECAGRPVDQGVLETERKRRRWTRVVYVGPRAACGWWCAGARYAGLGYRMIARAESHTR